jgi:hypothetical protein
MTVLEIAQLALLEIILIEIVSLVFLTVNLAIMDILAKNVISDIISSMKLVLKIVPQVTINQMDFV